MNTFTQRRLQVPEILEMNDIEGMFELKTNDSVYTVPAAVKDLVLSFHDEFNGRKININDMPDEKRKHINDFIEVGLIKDLEGKNEVISGEEFHKRYFSPAMDHWLDRAFSHPSWERLMQGQESKNVFIGWLFELFHYTKNANKHMPLAVAYCKHKSTKTQLAVHYKEEWNHYHFFRKCLEELGFTREEVESSNPLPMTDEMANFMREAARTDFVAYAACSAVLEGTTTDNKTYDNFYKVMQQKYDIPAAAIKPIYDHLELDQKYGHADLFAEVCSSIGDITNERAEGVMTYARMMSEHIYAWTANIVKYYSNPGNAMPRRKPEYLDA